MKRFISVLLAILMVVAVMPFAIFAADEADEGYVREKNTAHICHPVDEDGKLLLDALDLTGTLAFEKAATDVQVLEKYLTDGNKATATRLPVGATAKLTVTFAEAKDLATLTLTVNGKGKINPGEEFEAEVIAASKHNLKVKVVAYNGTTKVYEDAKEVDTTELTDLVVNIFEKATKIEITTVGAANATKGGPRLWEISATTVKGAADYVHTWAKTTTKLPSLPVYGGTDGTELINDGKGEYTQYCSACGCNEVDEDGEIIKYEIPAMTLADLNGGILGLDQIESFVEETGKFDENGDPILDDDGNPYTVTTTVNSKPENLFDGNHGVSNMWTQNGNYWYIGKDGKLTVTLKESVLVSYVEILATTNWTQLNITFYNGETQVAKMVNGPDGNAFGTADAKWYDLTEYLGISGKFIDKIVFESTYERAINYSKWGELEIGIHEHVYTDADIKDNGTPGTGEDVCKYTHKATCIECHAKANDAIAYLHDVKVNEVRKATCGDGIAYDTCNIEGCKYKSENYTVAGTGEHDFSSKVIQNTFATCGADGKATFVCSTCQLREELASGEMYDKNGNTNEKLAQVYMTNMMNLVGRTLAQDLVSNGTVVAKSGAKITESMLDYIVDPVIYLSATDVQTGEAVTVKWAVSGSVNYATEEEKKNEKEDAMNIAVTVGVVANGYHTLGYKNVVPSTYTAHGIDGGYCTVCGVEFKDVTREAALADFDTAVRVTDYGYTLRTTGYEGIRKTMVINKQVAGLLEEQGYSVRVWLVATNEAGVTKELQVYGAGASNWIDNDGKTSVVIKGVDADEVITFQVKISVKDKAGEQVVYRDFGSTTLAEVKAAGK